MAANVQAWDAALAATPSRLNSIWRLQLYCSHNAVAANVQVSDASLAAIPSRLIYIRPFQL